jgi:hypothetical protein
MNKKKKYIKLIFHVLVVLNRHGTSSLKIWAEYRLRVFWEKGLRKIFGLMPKRVI